MRFAILSAIVLLAVAQTALGNPLTSSTSKITKRQLKGKYSIDPKRVFLFGHSAGAVYALNLSMRESEYFAVTALHAGSWRSSEELNYVRLAKRKTPIAIFIVDQYFPIDSVKKNAGTAQVDQFPVQVT